jgi:hypothetical protein
MSFIAMTKSGEVQTHRQFRYFHIPECYFPKLNKETVDIQKELKLFPYLKNVVFWDVALCRSCVNRCFRGMCGLHLQGRKIREQEPESARGCRLSHQSETTSHMRIRREGE